MHLAAPVSTAPPPSTQALCASKTIACVPAYSVGVYLFVAMKVLVLLLMLLGCSQAKTVQLNYALFTATEGFDSSGAVPAIELAEQMVNSNDSILPGYTLAHIGIKDTKAS